MENSIFKTGQSVTSKAFGVGAVVSFDGKKITVDFNGTEKTLIAAYSGLKIGTSVVTKADKYKARKAKQARIAEAAKPKTDSDFINSIKVSLYMVNRKDNSSQNVFDAACNIIGDKAVKMNNTFVQGILDKATKYREISEKQAYCVASWAYKNGITL